MVSLLHEGLLELIRDRPPFLGYLLNRVLDVEVPQFTEARTDEATFSQLLRVPYHADAVVMFTSGKPVLGAIVEAQLDPDNDKTFTWPLYTVAARARHRCPFEMVVLTPDPATARWAQREIKLGNGMVFRAHVIGPDQIPQVTDPAQALQDPELAVLSAMAHGAGEVQAAVRVAQAAAAAVMQLSDHRRVVYSALIDAALSDAARKGLPDGARVSKVLQRAATQHLPTSQEGDAAGDAAAADPAAWLDHHRSAAAAYHRVY